MFHWICTQCGGSKSAPISIDTEIFQQSAMRPCDCSPHDGKLDDRDYHDSLHASVELQDDYGLCDGSKLVTIQGGHGDIETSRVYLDPKQALSLLSWLQQEKPMLEKLAKNEGESRDE